MNIKLLSVAAAVIATAACTDCHKSTDSVAASRDTLDNTVWSSYFSNGVDVVVFRNGMFTDRTYDAITGKEQQETKPYTIVENRIEVMQPDSIIEPLYFEITAGGNTLSIYKSVADLNDNRPNVVLKKL